MLFFWLENLQDPMSPSGGLVPYDVSQKGQKKSEGQRCAAMLRLPLTRTNRLSLDTGLWK